MRPTEVKLAMPERGRADMPFETHIDRQRTQVCSCRATGHQGVNGAMLKSLASTRHRRRSVLQVGQRLIGQPAWRGNLAQRIGQRHQPALADQAEMGVIFLDPGRFKAVDAVVVIGQQIQWHRHA